MIGHIHHVRDGHRRHAHVHGVHLHAREHDDQHLRERQLGAHLIGAAAAAEVYVVAGLEHLAEAVAADGDGGAARGGEEHAEGGELHGVVVKGAAGEDGGEELGGG